MAIVLTADQVGSRRSPDAVPCGLALLSAVRTRRGFERTAGDEIQGVPTSGEAAVDATLALVRDGRWRVGIGVGPVEEPLPQMTRAGRGPAFTNARAAVEAAKRHHLHLAVRGVDPQSAQDAEAVLALLAAVVARRSDLAWQAIDLLEGGLTMAEAADRLGVTRQAISQRVAAALWQEDVAGRGAAARLLTSADQ